MVTAKTSRKRREALSPAAATSAGTIADAPSATVATGRDSTSTRSFESPSRIMAVSVIQRPYVAVDRRTMPSGGRPRVAGALGKLAFQRCNDGVAHFAGRSEAAAFARDVLRPKAAREDAGDRGVEAVGRFRQAEGIAERHAEGADHCDGVRERLAGDVRGRAVNGLIEGFALAGFRISVAERGRGKHAERAGQHGRYI